MKKRGLLASICLFTLLMGGCAVNNESMTEKSNNDAISDKLDISVEEENHFWVNRHGEIFDSTNAPGGVDESLDTFVWMVFREGTIISEDMSAEDTELWTILKMAGYGDWLEKEIDIYVRMTTGL